MTGSSEPPGGAGRPRRLHERPLVEGHRFAIGVAVALWVLAGALFLFLAFPGTSDAVRWVDERVHSIAVDLESPAAVTVAEALDVIGGSWVTWPIMFGTSVLLLLRRRWEALTFWVSAMAVSQVLIGPLKALYGRERPPVPLVETSAASFPSGHSVAGAAIAVALVIVLVPAGPRRRVLELAAVLAATAMAMSRVYLRAHWLSDVVAGAALGAAVSVAAAVVVHRIDDRRHRGLEARS